MKPEEEPTPDTEKGPQKFQTPENRKGPQSRKPSKAKNLKKADPRSPNPNTRTYTPSGGMKDPGTNEQSEDPPKSPSKAKRPNEKRGHTPLET
jgi:hypothetical protein